MSHPGGSANAVVLLEVPSDSPAGRDGLAAAFGARADTRRIRRRAGPLRNGVAEAPRGRGLRGDAPGHARDKSEMHCWTPFRASNSASRRLIKADKAAEGNQYSSY